VQVMKDVPVFNNAQIELQVKKHIEFLSLVHPFLTDILSYHKECVEVRAISRKNNSARSFNFWRLDKTGIEKYTRFIKSINGKPYCVYYSLYTIDYNKRLIKSDGTPYSKGRINNRNALYTTTLGMDFDDISEDEHNEYLEILKSIGIDTIVINTGNGYQDLILLEDKVHDLNALKKFTNLLQTKGFKVDGSIIDPARVMRMPATFNCKNFDKTRSSYDPNKEWAIPAKLLKKTDKRLKYSEVMSALNKLPDKNTISPIQIDVSNLKTSDNNFINQDVASMDVPQESVYTISNVRDQYNMIDFDALPEAVRNMLIETKDGFRNSVLLFLVPFFKNKIGLSLDVLTDVLCIWGSRCNPPLSPDFIKSEVRRIYKYNYQGFGKYTGEMAGEFGNIDFGQYKRENKIIIQNRLFDLYSILSDTSVVIYLSMLLDQKLNDREVWTKKDLSQLTRMSERSIERNVKSLVLYKFVNKVNGNKRLGEEHIYQLNKFFKAKDGFTELGTALIDNILYNERNKLNKGEIKLYTYLCYVVGWSPEGECFMSRETIGKAIGKKESSISGLTSSLQKKKYIKKYLHYKNNVPHCSYILNY